MDADWIVLSHVFVCFAPGFVADLAAEAPPFLRSVLDKFFPFVLLSESRSINIGLSEQASEHLDAALRPFLSARWSLLASEVEAAARAWVGTRSGQEGAPCSAETAAVARDGLAGRLAARLH